MAPVRRFLPPPGGPILVVTSSADPFGSYCPEILRNEGLNEFDVADVEQPHGRHARGPRRRRPRHRRRHRRAGRRAHARGSRAGGQPHRDAARQEPRAAARPRRRRRHAVERQPRPSSAPGARRRHHRRSPAAVPRRGRPLRDWRARAAWPRWRPAAEPRGERRAPSAPATHAAFTYDLARVGRLHAPGQPSPGQARTATRSSTAPTPTRSSAPTTSSSARAVTAARLGRPQPRRGPAGGRAAAAAGQPHHPVQQPRRCRASGICPRGHKAVLALTGDDHGSRRQPTRRLQAAAGRPRPTRVLRAQRQPDAAGRDGSCPRATSYLYPDNTLDRAQARPRT